MKKSAIPPRGEYLEYIKRSCLPEEMKEQIIRRDEASRQAGLDSAFGSGTTSESGTRTVQETAREGFGGAQEQNDVISIEELRRNYSERELSYFPGDGELRYRLFAPLLANLFENKVVYRARFVCLVRLENIKITPERFEATVVPLKHIEFGGDWRPEPPPRPWVFGAIWGAMCLSENLISAPYASWSIWPEPDLVREVERLAEEGDFEGALSLTAHAGL